MQLNLDAFLFIGSSINHMEAKLKLFESDDGDEDLSQKIPTKVKQCSTLK